MAAVLERTSGGTSGTVGSVWISACLYVRTVSLFLYPSGFGSDFLDAVLIRRGYALSVSFLQLLSLELNWTLFLSLELNWTLLVLASSLSSRKRVVGFVCLD